MLAAGIIVNLGALALWAVSRTAGAPFGPHAGEPEVVQGADLCALLLPDLCRDGGRLGPGTRGQQERADTAFANAIILVGAVAFIALASTVGVAFGATAPEIMRQPVQNQVTTGGSDM